MINFQRFSETMNCVEFVSYITKDEIDTNTVLKDWTQNKAMEFVNKKNNELLYGIYKGYCLGYVLLNKPTEIKKWKSSDYSIVKNLNSFVLDLVNENNKEDICKLIKMLYFLDLIKNDKVQTRRETFYEIFKESYVGITGVAAASTRQKLLDHSDLRTSC